MRSSRRSSSATARSCAGVRSSSGGEPGGRGVVSAASYEARKFGVHSAMSLARGRAAVPERRLPAGRRAALPAGQPGRHGDPPAVHAAVRADLDRRGVPRCHGLGRPVRRRPDDRAPHQGGGPRRRRADRLGRRGDATSSSRRSRRTCASRTGSSSCRPARRRPSWRRCRSDGSGGSARRPRSRWPTTGSGRSATSRRCSGTVMEGRFGKHGASLAERARGIDTDPVHDGDPAKSVGHEHTFDRGHDRPRDHRTDAARDGRWGGWAAPVGRRSRGHHRDPTARRLVPHDQPPADARPSRPT